MLILVVSIVVCAGGGFCAYAKAPAPVAVGGVLDLRHWDFAHDGPVTLSGEWEFYWRQLYTGAEPGLGTTLPPDGMLSVPGSWHRFRLPDGSPAGVYGYATLRLRVLLPANATQQPEAIMRFYLKDACSAYQAQVFDQAGQPLSPVMRGGVVGIDPASTVDARRSETAIVLPAQEWQILWQVGNFSNPVHAGPVSSPRIGLEAQLHHILTMQWLTVSVNLGILLVMAVYHFVLFVLRPNDRALLWFSVLCFEIAGRMMGTENYFGLLLPDARVWWAGHLAELLSFSLGIPTFVLFIRAMFPRQAVGRFHRIFLVAGTVYTGILLLAPLAWQFWATIAYELVMPLFAGWVFVVLIRALRSGDRLASIIAFGSVVLALFILNDILYAELIIRSVDLTPYGQTVFILCQAIVIAIANQKAHTAWRQAEQEKHALQNEALRISQENERLVREQNLQLEQKVSERTEELVHAKEFAETAWRNAEDDRRNAENAQRIAEQAQHAAEDANLAKNTFLASMSHELRTPLSAILGYAQIIQFDEALPDKHRKSVATIYRNGEHLLLMINDLLDLAKIEAGKYEVHPAALPFASFLTNLAENARFRSQRPEIPILLVTPDALPTVVYTDERYLRQILENLLNNAVKFTETGSITLRIAEADTPSSSDSSLPEGYSTQKAFRFEVEDTGVGIPEDDLPKIFLTFYQVRHSRLSQSGSGLGLAISQRLVHLLGGELSVRSQVGQGTIFRFELTLPISDDRQTPSPFQMASSVTGYTGPSKTILVIEDNAEHRGFLRDMLEPLDFVVKEASSGEMALEIVHDANPDLIFVDIFLSGMDGFETMRRIRAALQPASVVVVAISASPQMKQASVTAGCDDFLAKPIQIDHLLHCLGQHLHLEWTFIESERGLRE